MRFDQHPLFQQAHREMKDKNPVACLETCRAILKDEPQNPIIRLYSAGCYFFLKQYDECISHLEKVILQRPRDLEAHHLKGLALVRQGHLDKALLYFESALKINDRHVPTVIARAQLLEEMGRYEDAAYGFRKATFINRTHQSCFRAAECYAKLKKYQDALDYYDMALENWKFHTPTYLGKARVLQEQGKLSSAIDVIDELLHENPGDLDGMLALAILYSKMERYQKALDAVEDLLQKGNDENIAALELKAAVLHKLNRLPDALDIYQKLLLRTPKDSTSLRAKSEILSAMGDNEGAASAGNLAKELEKGEIDTLLQQGTEAWKNMQYELALELYEKLARIEPDHPTAALGRGISLTHLGRAKEAKSALQYALALQPNTPIAHYYLGKIHRALDDFPNAIKAFKKAYKQQPGNIDALLNVAQLHVLLKEYDEAVEVFDEVLEKEPELKAALDGKLAALKAANAVQ